MKNYFNSLNWRDKLQQLGKCELVPKEEFSRGVQALLDKKIVIIGCGSQGLNQGLNMRDSGLDVSYALRDSAIKEQRESFQQGKSNNFKVGGFEEMIPTADVVINLTPDKQHSRVVNKVVPMMKPGAVLSYSHGFNIVEEGQKIRKDITVIMVAPKSPGSEVRQEYLRGFGVPTLIAVHNENDPENKGFEIAKAYAFATGGHRAGVLLSSFVAEVKSDLMGEQTILCGVLQTGSILSFDKMVAQGVQENYAAKLVQMGWEVITDALKQGGISLMMERLSNPAKIACHQLSETLKERMRPLFQHHMEEIMSGNFSTEMMEDWKNEDAKLLNWRKQTGETAFEKTKSQEEFIDEQSYFDQCTFMVALVKSGVELAFETMVDAGMKEESAYYESLHEAPLIANTIARKKLYEMNRIISDTAEYGCYLFDNACRPLLKDLVFELDEKWLGNAFSSSHAVDNLELETVLRATRNHPIEKVGELLRSQMTNVKES